MFILCAEWKEYFHPRRPDDGVLFIPAWARSVLQLVKKAWHLDFPLRVFVGTCTEPVSSNTCCGRNSLQLVLFDRMKCFNQKQLRDIEWCCPSVCLFVCLSVACDFWNLLSDLLSGSTWWSAAVYHVESDTLAYYCLLLHEKLYSFLCKLLHTNLNCLSAF